VANKTRVSVPQVVIGVCGGSGSGKSQLSQYLVDSFPKQSSVICHDWYYKDNSHLNKKDARALNFDHPSALDTHLMSEHIDHLLRGEKINAPIYNYAAHSRLAQTQTIKPRPLLIVDGILILHEKALRDRMTLSVYIDVPDDIRLLRRVHRDATERRVKV
jgi:uridine kinase